MTEIFTTVSKVFSVYTFHFIFYQVKEMVVNIKQILKNLLEGTTWMDADTKKKAIEKLKALKEHIAYPDLVELSDLLDEFYGSVGSLLI